MDEEVGGQQDGKEVRRVGRGIGFVPQENENNTCYRNAKVSSVLTSLLLLK